MNRYACLLIVAVALNAAIATAQEAKLPKNGLSPAQAVAKMKLAEGFKVQVYAAEPHCVQPFAMCFDDRGRLWAAENMHYQSRGRHQKAGDAKSRISIYEDTDGDGKFDKKKVFVEDIFFPTGLERGHGGIWVGSPPNLYFIPDRNEDDKPDGPPEVVLDGWGINDRHETLNSFIWGPDGWLYGCHGVFTHSKVGKPGAANDERERFNAGFWRYHPVTKKFELFAEGVSNQWALTFDDHGQAFATACVIPHLWHIIQGGRYRRQAGRHTIPYTYNDIKTIADHKHASAHGGARVYLADNFPKEYRNRLIMGNIHVHGILTDVLERKGSGYVGHHGSDLLMANDKLSIMFQMEIGPEGAAYVLDWYDNDICGKKVDPQVTGRIYRIGYGDVKTPINLHLSKLSDAELVKLLLHVNDWYGRQARRILHERAVAKKLDKGTNALLLDMLKKNPEVPRKLRALWSLHVTGGLTEELAARLLSHESEYLRAWTIQLICEDGSPGKAAVATFAKLAKKDPSPLVRKYLASALQRLPLDERWAIAEALVAHEEDAKDHNLPLMYWYGIEPLVPHDKTRALTLAAKSKIPILRQYIARRSTSGKRTGRSTGKSRTASNAKKAEWGKTLAKVAPGFGTDAVGLGGVAWMFDYQGRAVVRTHPVNRKTPCILRRDVRVPSGKKTTLKLVAGYHRGGDWYLVVRANGKQLADQLVGPKTAKKDWVELAVDLTPLAGKTVAIEIENRANGARYGWAYWNEIKVVSE
jgi:putative membrane-bound dehydrogenase-like protein